VFGKAQKMNVLVFVFGTLKEGFPNFRINRGRRVAGEFHTVLAYPLYLVGDRNSPWLLDSANVGHHVGGQVFEVTPDVLRDMDSLERIDEPDGYTRREILVRNRETNAELCVQAYLKNPDLFWPVSHTSIGPIPEYTAEHAVTYQPRR
jgi:gamma-glutamylaminecyclotransferase